MLDWKIKPLAKKSAVTGTDINPGDVIVCAVFVDALGNLDRLDFHKDEFDASKVDGKVIGRWERTASDHPEADERAARRMALAGSEDFFVSLFDEDSAVVTDEVDVVKQMLGLLLERKRILKSLGRPSRGVQKYLHPASGREFSVPQNDLDENLILKIQTQLGCIII